MKNVDPRILKVVENIRAFNRSKHKPGDIDLSMSNVDYTDSGDPTSYNTPKDPGTVDPVLGSGSGSELSATRYTGTLRNS